MPYPYLLKNINIITKFEFSNLGLMLLLLLLAIQSGSNHYLISSLLIAHIGFFLLWQPALNASQMVHIKAFIPVLGISVALYWLLGDWFIALWIILLTGLTSGSALVNGVQRSLYALAAVILFLQLSLMLTPRLFNLEVLDPAINQTIFYFIFTACMFIIFWPNKKNRSVKIDYLHSLLISFGLFSFYITSILISFTSHIYYLQSLLITALSIGSVLLFLSIILLPRYGISGIGQMWEQHILNIGNPFENWVKQTSLLGKNKKITPELFLKNSIEHLLTLSWVSGIHWTDSEHTALYGAVSKHHTVFEENDIKMTLYSFTPMGSALNIHAQLLMHLMSYFYNSKLREITLKNQTHLKAVYETGSKLTHDIKNILQALQALTGVVQASEKPEDSYQLINKQLPLLTQRLQNTLDKLQTKTDTGRSIKNIEVWWKELQSRYHGRDINFIGDATQDINIDTDVFDSIIENLLENARNKRRTNPHTKISTHLDVINKNPVISVSDNGDPVPTSKMDKLFKQILPSKDGYGIGLYQSAQLAERNGYRLELINNEPGNVCFRISTMD